MLISLALKRGAIECPTFASGAIHNVLYMNPGQKVSGQKVSGHKVSKSDMMCHKVSSEKVSKLINELIAF